MTHVCVCVHTWAHCVSARVLVCVYLGGLRAEDACGGGDEVPHQHGEAWQPQEEEARGAGADHRVQHILHTHTLHTLHTHTHYTHIHTRYTHIHITRTYIH